MTKLILMRHGASAWNEQNLFTGWVDVPLSKKGVAEAIKAGGLIKSIPIDIIYTSSLVRSLMTALLALNEHESKKVPVLIHTSDDNPQQREWEKFKSKEVEDKIIPLYQAWELNERMYGDLQGLNKDEARAKFGVEQVEIWRRSYDIPPPEGESLELTAARTLPFFEETIVPLLKNGKNVFISAHGNSLRSIIMKLNNLSKEEVVKLEIATGEPILYDFSNGSFNVSRDLPR